jgi:hypothetical protein
VMELRFLAILMLFTAGMLPSESLLVRGSLCRSVNTDRPLLFASPSPYSNISMALQARGMAEWLRL